MYVWTFYIIVAQPATLPWLVGAAGLPVYKKASRSLAAQEEWKLRVDSAG